MSSLGVLRIELDPVERRGHLCLAAERSSGWIAKTWAAYQHQLVEVALSDSSIEATNHSCRSISLQGQCLTCGARYSASLF
jgi:hypothetical protein